MKFRISSKDLIMFIIFVIFLLYLCAITTSNISSFGSTGTFSGLNPILGFTKYLGATLVLFIIFLVVIFTSVSSYIFDRKKGIGIELGEKDNKGYSRWCKEKEMKNDQGVEVVDPLVRDSQVAGIPLVNDGKHLWVDNGEYHNLVIGSTGSGKSQTVVEPMVELLIKKGESMIITDPKGELYKAASTYMQERGYNVVVLNFREPQNGNAWNPLTLPYQYYQDGNFDKATELLDDVGLNILYDPNNKSGDPFWEKSAADYFSGLALGLFEDATQDEINLNSINFMSTVGEEKFAASNYIKEYFTLKGEASNAYVFASNTINSPTDTKGGILSVFRQKIRLFASRENLSEMLAYSDFDMRNIGKEKTAVFIIIHDEKTTYHGLATIFIKQCYETLIDVAQANGGKLPFRTNFILDEFANMPPLKDVTTMVTAARSRAIRFTFIIQNFAQLKSVYGNEDAETIKGNCGNLIYLISTELAALEEISKMCGEVKSGDKDKTASTPLVTVTDLQKLKLFEAIIIRWRLSPFKTKYTPNFQMDWGHPKHESTFPVRKKREIKLFDVKEFTKKKKSEKIKNSLNEKGPGFGDNPFKDGGNPFGNIPNPPNNPNNNPFNPPKNDNGLFGGLGGGIDLDAMMKDIDRKIAELDAEEARQKEEQAKIKEAELKKIEPPQVASPNLNIPHPNNNLNNIESKNVNKGNINLLNEQKNNQLLNGATGELLNTPIKEGNFEEKNNTSIENNPTINNYNNLPKTIEDVNLNNFNIFDNPITKAPNIELKNSTDKPKIAVATSSPVDEEDFKFEALPKVEQASVITPTYNSGSIITPNDTNNYNIYNSVPNIMDNAKENIKNYSSNEVPKIDNEKNQFNNYNIFNDNVTVKPVTDSNQNTNLQEKNIEKPNVNIDPDKIIINSNNTISDDEFFDDFFGDE